MYVQRTTVSFCSVSFSDVLVVTVAGGALLLSSLRVLSWSSVLALIGSIKAVISLFKFAPQAALHRCSLALVSGFRRSLFLVLISQLAPSKVPTIGTS